MNQEQKDFDYFRENQLCRVDFTKGCIDAVSCQGARFHPNVGSENDDGYIRVWCNGKLRMMHRLLYYLYHNDLPKKGEEIDHHDSIRNHNWISNLQILLKSVNNTNCANCKIGRFTPEIIHLVCRMLTTTTLSDLTIANETGVSRATVRDIKTRRSRQSISSFYSWEHRGY